MDELNVATTTELAEATTEIAVTSNNRGFWKGTLVGAAITVGAIATCRFGKKIIKKFKANKAEKEAEKPVEANIVEPESK